MSQSQTIQPKPLNITHTQRNEHIKSEPEQLDDPNREKKEVDKATKAIAGLLNKTQPIEKVEDFKSAVENGDIKLNFNETMLFSKAKQKENDNTVSPIDTELAFRDVMKMHNNRMTP